jgi:hypothetical protein
MTGPLYFVTTAKSLCFVERVFFHADGTIYSNQYFQHNPPLWVEAQKLRLGRDVCIGDIHKILEVHCGYTISIPPLSLTEFVMELKKTKIDKLPQKLYLGSNAVGIDTEQFIQDLLRASL